ncbi:MAG TPA: endolytic transglycosylase MltG, partial [Gemmatimonadales bacterium]|nr:endolytic transglycosylase MltG [Gemmatimonadales bacterium]
MRRAAAGLLLAAACAGAPGEPVQVTIPKGASFRAITDSLRAHGIIEHPTFFRLLARVRRLDRSVKAGTYRLPQGSSSWDVIHALQRGDQLLVKVTLPEGLTVREMAPLVAAQLGVPADSFIAAAQDTALPRLAGTDTPSAEGVLLPETYLVPQGTDARTFARIMTEAFARAWNPQWDTQLATLGLTRAQLVTLASIVEGEARVDEERPVIAGVYHNRLRRRMPLQADPTVQYGIQLATGARKPRLLNKDYQFPSPYNTYLNPGLPPGPVNSPGLRSIEATLYPAEVPYLFFVAG